MDRAVPLRVRLARSPFASTVSLLATLLLLAGCGGGSDGQRVASQQGPEPGLGHSQSQSERGYSLEVFALTNDERTRAGLPPLVWDERAAQASIDHSVYQRWLGDIQHEGPRNNDAGDRLEAAGVTWSAWAENVAVGFDTPAEVMRGWMDSPGHRANILRKSVTHLGVGTRFGSGGNYRGPWSTQNFFRP